MNTKTYTAKQIKALRDESAAEHSRLHTISRERQLTAEENNLMRAHFSRFDPQMDTLALCGVPMPTDLSIEAFMATA